VCHSQRGFQRAAEKAWAFPKEERRVEMGMRIKAAAAAAAALLMKMMITRYQTALGVWRPARRRASLHRLRQWGVRRRGTTTTAAAATATTTTTRTGWSQTRQLRPLPPQ